MWVPGDKVAEAGIEGLAAGKAVVVPGRVNRVAPPELLLAVLTRSHPAMKRV